MNNSVSVIIPAYNGEKFIVQTLERVVRQTRPPTQIVVIDDGSQDNTAKLVEEFARTSPIALQLISQPNGGTQAARNHGLKYVTGQLIALLDQDDLWQLNFLEEMVANWEKAGQPEAVIYCNYQVVDEQMLPLGAPCVANFAMPSLLLSAVAAPSTVIFPRQIFDKVGTFDPAYLTVGDWDWWIRAVLLGVNFLHVNQALVLYRVHSGNTTRQSERVLNDHTRLLQQVYKRPDLPQNLRRLESRIMAADQLCQAYTYYALIGQNQNRPEGEKYAQLSRAALAQALTLHPNWKFIPIIFSAFARSSLQGRYTGSPVWLWDAQAANKMQAATEFVVKTILESDSPNLRPFQKQAGRLKAFAALIAARLLLQYRRADFPKAIRLAFAGLGYSPLAAFDQLADIIQKLRRKSWLD